MAMSIHGKNIICSQEALPTGNPAQLTKPMTRHIQCVSDHDQTHVSFNVSVIMARHMCHSMCQ